MLRGNPQPAAPHYMVYRVFTVFSTLAGVNKLFKLCAKPLFFNHPAGNPVPGISRRIGLQVVCLGMDNQGRPAITK